MLSIETYDQCEQRALRTAAYRAISSFAPTYFNSTGFPTRVREECELRRYVDCMGEMTPRETWRRERLHTRHEADAMAKLADQIVDLTGRLFTKVVYPLIGLWAPITMFRMVQHLSHLAGRSLMVMDVGAGCGYLDAYMLNAGHRVFAVDNTQALYLWQNRLFSDYGLNEWVNGFSSLPTKTIQVTHIPWWDFVRVFERPFLVDVVVCDAALAEMNWFAACYTMRLAREMTKHSPVGCLLYRHPGDNKLGHGEDQILQYARQIGFLPFKLVDAPDGMVVLASDNFLADERNQITAPPPWGGEPTLKIDDFLDIKMDQVAESYAFCDFIGVGN